MSTALTAINEALNGGIKTTLGALPIVWENVAYAPAIPVPYARVMHIARFVNPTALGEDALNEHRGLTQVSFFQPLDIGTDELYTQADLLATGLKRGTRLNSGGIYVTIESVYPSGLIYEKAWAHLPVTLSWRSFAGN